MKFFDRRRELAGLDAWYGRSEGIMYVVYGRRRIGKTALLEHWLETRQPRALFWTSRGSSAAAELRNFSRAVRRFISPEGSVAADFSYDSWQTALDDATRAYPGERIVLVLDEFTYLVQADRSILGELQVAWDHILKKRNLLLILTGSHAGLMEREVLNGKSPLYNRALDGLRLGALPFSVTKEFLPEYTAEERVALYGCVGGVPLYLELFDPRLPFDDNMVRLLGTNAILDDAGALLRDQLTEPRNYMAVVESIASGFTRLGEIARMSGLAESAAGKYLGVLQRLGIVARAVPATVSRPEESKQGRYRVVDSYLRFYFRFVQQHRGAIERGRLAQAWQNMRQHLSEFIGKHAFEELCREWVESRADQGQLGFVPRRIGAWWERKGREIDVCAVNEDEHAVLLGECKWTNEPLGERVVRELIRDKQPLLGLDESWTVRYAFFSRSGFTPEALRAVGHAPCDWVDLQRLDSELPD